MSQQHPRIAIVTGATSGIGEATAKRLVAAGFGVVGNGRNADKLATLEAELGAGFCGVAGDAADADVLDTLFATAETRFSGAPDTIVVNAGRGLGGSVKDADLAQFEEVLRINVLGAATLMQKAAQRLVATQQDAFPRAAADIVVIGSVVGRQISPFSAVYGSSKFAVHSLVEGLRREVGPKGVRVSLVEPGIVVSGFQAVAGYSDRLVEDFDERFGPLLVGEDIAEAIHFIVTQPPHVHLSEIVVRPTRQDYP
ncbi:short-chain alcohol dehydrogenase [Thioflavicoccus mobilis 8321]|uniref:Short-chain alcohol dehydrogenase n=1 Tax=Thioflavicoccus mobilis 8321 TaxID=765912 RepID=L0H2W1_9GAMM|nr:SDR family oxidoreductase [Thioflavicoccus mobilis]AGA91970.1 short-chain alcohol dehydrogenase [Thioflavicoccus mobilis 8321]